MSDPNIAIVGGGPAGFFAAIACAEASPRARITVLEKGPRFLDKVRISGGGRCNVTHACFDPRTLADHYPRGGSALIGPFHQFNPNHTLGWFAKHGVPLKTESDGRLFPVTDTSATIVRCLIETATHAGVNLRLQSAIENITRQSHGAFLLQLSNNRTLECDRLLLATGGCRSGSAGHLATSLGHTLKPPVPSLFAFRLGFSWLQDLAGVSVPRVAVSVPNTDLCECGPILLTHSGISGPAILRLSAWGAPILNELGYRFPLRLNWFPDLTEADIARHLDTHRQQNGARQLATAPLPPLPSRLWRQLLTDTGLPLDLRWAQFTRASRQNLLTQLHHTQWNVEGRSLNQDEFVTCGGVNLNEVNFKTMESRICPRLFFAGELLDIDGLTGGFNFQAAWTTGWIAGRSMAISVSRSPASNHPSHEDLFQGVDPSGTV
ncbi:MAG TPA: NAD(P)/FAD-dependent oxidoreductase [Candidatus Paceibacterota bacterium]|nr:NAD(P)/FAD-dependent oxidoreductase [Verrucomicrobiota bacterium]HRY48927.1 NAD(P)/FAD-dependent oxidoreductase [Candidatus Paceibacterota bacterium]HRZ99139.1 NAD(P)/FAD-dependent oxidoreductase [Candidatus Paceibacterota bacterium]